MKISGPPPSRSRSPRLSGLGAFFSRWPLPRFEMRLRAPDISRWRAGTDGIPGVVRLEARARGPHVAVVAVMHGNEIAGAVLLARLLAAGIAPLRGRLTLVFANLAAFDRFDPQLPVASRYVEEDLNRVWDPARLDGPPECGESALDDPASCELARARALRPVFDSADVVLDLHSMFWPGEPLILCGASARGRALAMELGCPPMVVADRGHPAGPRLIDYPRFLDPAGRAIAILVEAGQHWAGETVATMAATLGQLLRHFGMIAASPLLPVPPLGKGPRIAEVLETVVARTDRFAFAQPWPSGTVLARRNTLVASDGPAEIRTPCEDCLLVMPSLHPVRGQTAVRLARFAPSAAAGP